MAVVFEGQTLTYAELNERANRLAHYLVGLGVGRGSLVAVSLERSLELVVAIYGTVKAGAAYVPVDPGYPAERVAFLLEDAQAAVILTQSALAERLAGPGRRLVCVDALGELAEYDGGAAPVTGVGAGDLAYVIYTSGSTGQPPTTSQRPSRTRA